MCFLEISQRYSILNRKYVNGSAAVHEIESPINACLGRARLAFAYSYPDHSETLFIV